MFTFYCDLNVVIFILNCLKQDNGLNDVCLIKSGDCFGYDLWVSRFVIVIDWIDFASRPSCLRSAGKVDSRPNLAYRYLNLVYHYLNVVVDYPIADVNFIV